ncbi:MAG: alpha/beta hydrolase [Solirubrobacteraceae bacterium]
MAGQHRDRAAVTGLRVLLVALSLLALGATGASASTRHHKRGVDYHHNAVIFVHGFEGSGAQFESQKLRLTSNGYPARYITVFEYNSLEFSSALKGGSVQAQEGPLFTRMDHLIARMKKLTHRSKVDLLAHSLGTRLMQDYLNSSHKRAATVGHYVNMDGFPENSLPGGVPTLALWGTKGPISSPGRRIKGAQNVQVRDASHVQVATCPFSFKHFYKFFTGSRPRTARIVPQKGFITLSGRALNFPQNSGLSGATIQVWSINQATGQRTGKKPIASITVGGSGYFGPIKARAGKRYEFASLRPGEPTHHFYYEPFIRSDHLIRLLESDALRSAGGAPDPSSVAMVILRYKELWGDQGEQSDVLKINGLKVCNSTTCPLSKEVNGLFAADFNHDGKSETTDTWPAYQQLGFFVSSVDVFAPAHTPPTGKVTVSIQDRGHGPTRSLTFPNFAGTTDDVTVQLNDYDQP